MDTEKKLPRREQGSDDLVEQVGDRLLQGEGRADKLALGDDGAPEAAGIGGAIVVHGCIVKARRAKGFGIDGNGAGLVEAVGWGFAQVTGRAGEYLAGASGTFGAGVEPALHFGPGLKGAIGEALVVKVFFKEVNSQLASGGG